MILTPSPTSVLLICLGSALLVSCGSKPVVEAATPATVSQPSPVAVAKASREPLKQEITLSGEFKPYQLVDVHAKVAGYLRQIKVDVGDRVQTGQQLATLEVPEMHDDVAQASAENRRSSADLLRLKSELERAEASYALIHLSYQRLQTVMKSEPGLIAQQEIDEALGRKRIAEAQVSTAKAAIAASEQEGHAASAKEKRTRTLTDYTIINAPFSGVVTRRFADTGALVQAGTSANAMPIVRIAEISRLRLVLPVAESLVSQVRLGQTVQIRVTSLNRKISGVVARFTGDVQLATRTMDVEVDVPNPGGMILPGMYAEVILLLQHNDKALTVPVQALTGGEGKRAVLVVNEQGVIEERRVRTGMQTAARIEVTNGLQAGELVVVGNKTQLRAGEKVDPKLGS